MRSTVWLLAWHSLWDRPRRTLVLFAGYGIGVAVMIALLSVGEALLAQAQDRDLVAGGDLVLLPEGVDPAVLKVSGITDLSFTIQEAGFVVREVLAGPRFAQEIAAAAPQIDARQIYVRRAGRVLAALASGGIPSLDAAARATGAVPGARDSTADAAWIAPAARELLDRLDRFHRVPRGAGPTWAEWDYFTFTDPRSGAYGYLTVLAGGEGRGAVLVRIRRPDRPVEDISIRARIAPGDLSERSADQRVGPAQIRNEGGRYHVTVSDPRLSADLWVSPDGGFYLPPGEISGDVIVSGYVVPVVRGSMSGYLRTPRGDVRLDGAPAYHDHNWGTWRGVTWEWGEASGTGGAVLYGGLHVTGAGGGGPAAAQRPPLLFAWRSAAQDGTPGRGRFLGGFPVRGITYSGWHPGPILEGRRLSIPSLVTIDAGSGSDRITVSLRVRDGLASVATQVPASASAGKAEAPRAAFVQLRGIADVQGTVDGHPFAFAGGAAAETFVPFSR